MNSKSSQSPEKIKQIAMELDNALENKDFALLKTYFAEDCTIEFLNLTLKGKKGLEKWLHFVYNYIEMFTLEPIVIMVQNDVFFEEFMVIARLSDGSTIKSKWAEVLIYENYKIKSLRLYFDRLDFAKAVAPNWIVRKILSYLDKKTLEGLV
ncbi:MAG: hypothetical protein BAJALOKI1v1_170001 [Promethearchaeota archaeon]|nr:MAG: hypothetical protein BAJALOKI1v1_170001 [Candidatus Lokiarchaeota archaeon]